MAGFALFIEFKFDTWFPITLCCVYPKIIVIKFDNSRIIEYGKSYLNINN